MGNLYPNSLAILCPIFIKVVPIPCFWYSGKIDKGAKARTILFPTIAFVKSICPTILSSISATKDNSGIKLSLFLNAFTSSCSFPSECSALVKAAFITKYTLL